MFGLSKREKKRNDATATMALIGEGYRRNYVDHLLGCRAKVEAELACDKRAHMLAEMEPFLGPEDYEGYEVQDPLGQRVGRAEKFFVNGDGDPKHVRVRLGFLGKSVLIPVVGIKANHERRTIVLGSSDSFTS